MIIKIGTSGSETEFDAVNVSTSLKRSLSKHEMLAGNVKTQEATELYKIFTLNFVRLTESDLSTLESIFSQAGSINLLLETEDYLTDHTIKCEGNFDSELSSNYPGCYEAKLSGVEVD